MTVINAPRTPIRTVTVLLTLVALLLLGTLHAAAHPFVRGGGEVPVDSLATITLDLAHGCGTEAAGDGADTLEVALEVPEWLRVVEIAAHEGYEHEVEVTEGRVEVVTWLEAGGPEPAPRFDLDVVAAGEAGETRYLAVFQGCADQSYRWIGTPDEPADDPAVRVQLVAADPDSPPPPEEPFEDPDAAQEDAGQEEGATEPTDEETTDQDGPEDAEAAEAEEDVETLAEAGEDDGGGGPLLWVLLAVVVLGVLVAVLRVRNSGRTSEGDGAAEVAAGGAAGR